MKKIVSLLTVALFATMFAAGCGKFTKCEDAKSADDCTEAKFEKDKFKCDWKAPDASKPTEKKCVERAGNPVFTATQAAKDECAKHNADAATCNAADLSTIQADAKCKHTTGGTPNACAAVQK